MIGQHGAAMSLIGYVPRGGVVVELESSLNAIFDHIASAAGLSYKYVRKGEDLYLTSDFHHINVSVHSLAHIVNELLHFHERGTEH